eukprot:gene2495-1555_t
MKNHDKNRTRRRSEAGLGDGEEPHHIARQRKEVQEKAEEPHSKKWMQHPFKANFNDHFETSSDAIGHIFCVVRELRDLVRPSAPDRFSVYDPYYCSGAIAKIWERFGVSNFIHENRDFYADIESGSIPAFDMLVTNPPFSDDHIQRLLKFLLDQDKPWAFLAPEYIATKEWYKKTIEERCSPAPVTLKGNIHAKKGEQTRPSPCPLPPFLSASSAMAAESHSVKKVPLEPFYVVPPGRYDFQHPLGVGHDHSHFKSIWYVSCGRHTTEVKRGAAFTKFVGGASQCISALDFEHLGRVTLLEQTALPALTRHAI